MCHAYGASHKRESLTEMSLVFVVSQLDWIISFFTAENKVSALSTATRKKHIKKV